MALSHKSPNSPVLPEVTQAPEKSPRGTKPEPEILNPTPMCGVKNVCVLSSLLAGAIIPYSCWSLVVRNDEKQKHTELMESMQGLPHGSDSLFLQATRRLHWGKCHGIHRGYSTFDSYVASRILLLAPQPKDLPKRNAAMCSLSHNLRPTLPQNCSPARHPGNPIPVNQGI